MVSWLPDQQSAAATETAAGWWGLTGRDSAGQKGSHLWSKRRRHHISNTSTQPLKEDIPMRLYAPKAYTPLYQ